VKKFTIYVIVEGKGTETVTVLAEKVTVAAEGGVTFFVKSTIVAFFTPPNFVGFISEEAMP
jgi:hypothetical protein